MELSWSPCGSLMLVSSAKTSGSNGESAAPGESFEARPMTRYSHPAVRKLVNESHGIFHKLQNWATSHPKLGAQELIRISCEYRSCLRSTCISLQECLTEKNPSPGESSPQDSQDLLDLYRSSELIWSLAELLFLRPQSGSVTLDLLDWAMWNFTQADEWSTEILAATDLNQTADQTTSRIEPESRPENHSRYWDTIYLYTLFGRCSEAVKLLQLHTRKYEGAFRSIVELLRKIPLQALGSDPNQWEHWQGECQRRLKCGHYMAYPELEQIVKILCGEEEIYSLLGGSLSWYEVLIPLVLYKQSDAKLFDLQDFVENSLQLSNTSVDSLRTLDQILISLLELDVLRALKELSAHCIDWWLPGHLGDVLFHAGCKDLQGTGDRHSLFPDLHQQQQAQTSMSLREFLLVEYAQSLMGHPSLWQLGVDYLDACPLMGEKILCLYLEKIAPNSDLKAMKLIRIAEERGLQEISKGICRELAVRALKQEQLNVALGWCLESKDPNFATFMAEKCLQEYGRSGLLHGLHLLDQIGDTMILSPALIFLGKYREFHKFYREGKMKEAGDLLCELLKSRVAPRKFWITLLLDALPLLDLDKNQVVFDCEQTYDLMGVVETIRMEREIMKSEFFAKTQLEIEELEEQIRFLDLALVKNLAKAIVAPSC